MSEVRMLTYMALFLLSLVFSILLTPVSIRLAHLLGAVDVPSERKIHTAPIPRLGGVAVFLAIALAVVMVVS